MFHIPAARSMLAQVTRVSNGTCLILVATKNGARRFSSKASPRTVSVFSRGHVTSSRHSAEATLSPEVSFDDVRTLKKPLKRIHLPSNIKFTTCPAEYLEAGSSASRLADEDYEIRHDTYSHATQARPLMLLFGWMLSKDKHIEKYREFWYNRGFDVLSVRTGPLDLLFPRIGGAHIARIVFDFLQQQQPRYDEILVHAFSVGGYQLAEVLNRIEERILEGDVEAEKLMEAFKGYVIDSCVFADDCPPGLSRAITLHPVWQPIIEKSISLWLKATKPFTLQRYYDVSKYLIQNERRVPGMLLFSKDDVVSSNESNNKVVDDWQANGTLSARKEWQSSVHVLHYKQHPQEYEEAVDKFVSLLNIKKRFPKKANIKRD